MDLKKLTADDFRDGLVFLLDKPLGWTSFDVVNRIKSVLKYKCGLKKLKIGHAGTLDPLASGLLIICCGRKTKSIDQYQAFEKEYSGSFFIGATTPSFDLETEINKEFPNEHITQQLARDIAKEFVGENNQLPPDFSAKQIDGKRAYDMARRGEDPKVKQKIVTIHKFEIEQFDLPDIYFNIVCSKGTYIRAIARDFGERLHSGAYLKALRRERIGEFKVDDAMSIDFFVKEIEANPNFDKDTI